MNDQHVFTVTNPPAEAGGGFGGPFLGLEFAYGNPATIQAKVASKAPFAAAHILMFDSAGQAKWFTFTGTQNISMTVDGINGLETVAFNDEGEEANHSYHLYAQGRSSDGDVGFVFVDDDDYLGGPFGGGWDQCSGYDYCSYPAWHVWNDSTKNLEQNYSNGNAWIFDGTYNDIYLRILNSGTSGTFVSLATLLHSIVPPWASRFTLFLDHSDNSTFVEFSHDNSISHHMAGGVSADADNPRITLHDASALYYKRSSGAGTITLYVTDWAR